MPEQRAKTSMSVMEMGSLLGLSKMEAYWLIKKGFFKTVMVGKRMRVMIDSFESWYASQSHYIKVKTKEGGTEDGVHC